MSKDKEPKDWVTERSRLDTTVLFNELFEQVSRDAETKSKIDQHRDYRASWVVGEKPRVFQVQVYPTGQDVPYGTNRAFFMRESRKITAEVSIGQKQSVLEATTVWDAEQTRVLLRLDETAELGEVGETVEVWQFSMYALMRLFF